MNKTISAPPQLQRWLLKSIGVTTRPCSKLWLSLGAPVMVLMVSTAALADTVFFSSTQRSTDGSCHLDLTLGPAGPSAPIPAGSTITSVSFTSVNYCSVSGCGPGQFRLDRISISHNGLARSVPNGTFPDWNGQEASGEWTTGIQEGSWGCPSTVSWSFTVTYRLPLPAPTQVIPNSGPTSGGTPVTIKGHYFRNPSNVAFSVGQESHYATNVQFIDSETLTAVTPAFANSGSAWVTVSEGNSVPNLFTFLASPRVDSVAPTQGGTDGGDYVGIWGANFDPSATVTFGGVSAGPIEYVQAGYIRVWSPPHEAGAVTVAVTVNGQTGSRANAFTYYPRPTITAISPTVGSERGGTWVTISGTNFGTSPQFPEVTVRFGGPGPEGRFATDVTVVNATTIQARTPGHAAGPVELMVMCNGLSTYRPNAFRYYSAAQIMSTINALLQ